MQNVLLTDTTSVLSPVMLAYRTEQLLFPSGKVPDRARLFAKNVVRELSSLIDEGKVDESLPQAVWNTNVCNDTMYIQYRLDEISSTSRWVSSDKEAGNSPLIWLPDIERVEMHSGDSVVSVMDLHTPWLGRNAMVPEMSQLWSEQKQESHTQICQHIWRFDFKHNKSNEWAMSDFNVDCLNLLKKFQVGDIKAEQIASN